MQIPIKLKSGKIVITGGNGFIAKHVIKKLSNLGYQITVIDRFQNSVAENINYILGDIREINLVREVMSKSDGVINLAGILGTSETIDNPRSTIDSNLKAALNIFNGAKEFNIPVVHITVGNYWMNNPYAITKHAAEKIALLYNHKYNTKITVVRGLNAYGENQKDKPVRKLMPNLIIPALKNEEILIYGDGEQIMDMIYVGDLSQVLINSLVLEHNNWNSIIEAGSGNETTVNEICELVLKITKSSSTISHISMRGGEPKNAVVLGDPKTMLPIGINRNQLLSLEEGIQKTVNFYKKKISN
tara:strand:+ start:38 stop:943 length:906 start_codon:yes stop_codon:yes gene_type:complete